MATPSQVRFKAKKVALAVALAALIVLLLAFPAELFNKTYDENEEEIHTVLTRMGLRRHHIESRLGLLVFVLVGAGMTVRPSGLLRSDASLARNLLGATPTDAVTRSSVRICVLMRRTICG